MTRPRVDPREIPELYESLAGAVIPNELCATLAPKAHRLVHLFPDDRQVVALVHAICSRARAFDADARRAASREGQLSCPDRDISCDVAESPSLSVVMTTGEVAEQLHVSRKTVLRRAARRGLEHRRHVDGRWLFLPEDVETLKEL